MTQSGWESLETPTVDDDGLDGAVGAVLQRPDLGHGGERADEAVEVGFRHSDEMDATALPAVLQPPHCLVREGLEGDGGERLGGSECAESTPSVCIFWSVVCCKSSWRGVGSQQLMQSINDSIARDGRIVN